MPSATGFVGMDPNAVYIGTYSHPMNNQIPAGNYANIPPKKMMASNMNRSLRGPTIK